MPSHHCQVIHLVTLSHLISGPHIADYADPCLIVSWWMCSVVCVVWSTLIITLCGFPWVGAWFANWIRYMLLLFCPMLLFIFLSPIPLLPDFLFPPPTPRYANPPPCLPLLLPLVPPPSIHAPTPVQHLRAFSNHWCPWIEGIMGKPLWIVCLIEPSEVNLNAMIFGGNHDRFGHPCVGCLRDVRRGRRSC